MKIKIEMELTGNLHEVELARSTIVNTAKTLDALKYASIEISERVVER